jgi:asparagine synthase (glutamine-hydrolysing)
MCGLAGIFHQPGSIDIDERLLHRMTGALSHRGPDGDGFHVEPGVGLGHRRLAIIDVGGGQQPMYNEDHSVVIVFNGEIYNHDALRETLQAEGHVFRNRCDTEAIIHAWESWGPECLQRLSGMFAFALWDRNRQTLFLARDRLGKKPLHYMHMPNGSLAFASELAALAEVPGHSHKIDPQAVDDFFTYGYIPDPRSIFQGISKLPAAHYLLLERGGRHAAPQRYWQVPDTKLTLTEAEAGPILLQRMKDSVAARLMADVPLGAFLSGGVDSSAIVALAAGLESGPVSTFTIGVEGAGDERPFAETVARRYKTAHHADATSFDYIAEARNQAGIFGEPFGDSSSVPTYAVCALARRHVTVALSGDGGDEVLGGYRRYQWHVMAEAVRSYIPAPLRRRVIGQLARAYPKLDRAPRWLRAKHTLTEISLDSALGYYRTVCKVHDDSRHALFSDRLTHDLDGYDPAALVTGLMDEYEGADPLRQAQHVDVATYLPGDILTKVDRTSMAASLEVRAPLLDYELVEWGLNLPPKLKLRGTEGKYLLKRTMEPFLPSAILYRRKQGFAMPLADQLRAGADRLRSLLLGEVMADCGLFRMDRLAQIIQQHQDAQYDHSGVLWLLLVFEGFLAAQAAPMAASRPSMDHVDA